MPWGRRVARAIVTRPGIGVVVSTAKMQNVIVKAGEALPFGANASTATVVRIPAVTFSTSASLTLREVPGRGSSSSPSRSLRRKREPTFRWSAVERTLGAPPCYLASPRRRPE